MILRLLILISLITSSVACSSEKPYTKNNLAENEVENKIDKIKNLSHKLQSEGLYLSISMDTSSPLFNDNINRVTTYVNQLQEIHNLAEEILNTKSGHEDVVVIENITLKNIVPVTSKFIQAILNARISNKTSKTEAKAENNIENNNNTGADNKLDLKPNYDAKVTALKEDLIRIEQEFHQLHNFYDAGSPGFIDVDEISRVVSSLSYDQKLIARAYLPRLASEIKVLKETLAMFPVSVDEYDHSSSWVNWLSLKADVPVLESIINRFETELSLHLWLQEQAQAPAQNKAS